MKKLLYFIFILSIQVTSGETSGWIDKNSYNEQKLKINNLKLLHFNDNGSKFYTLHTNNIIYYWDSNSGILLDSLIIPDKSAIAGFSKDGKSLCYYLPISTNPCNSFKIIITILDLSTKMKIRQ